MQFSAAGLDATEFRPFKVKSTLKSFQSYSSDFKVFHPRDISSVCSFKQQPKITVFKWGKESKQGNKVGFLLVI